ncbi:hypothetical protein BGZ94_000783 [Podila epigama]|nr:hypothetical protein BGZ94_000783 [Podila epigama]
MREGIILLLIFLWLLSSDDVPQTEYLQKALHQLHEEADLCANKTFRNNMTYPISETVSTELEALFDRENSQPRVHYYHNVTGSFKGTWQLLKDVSTKIDLEYPLRHAPPKNDTETSTTGDSVSTSQAPDNGSVTPASENSNESENNNNSTITSQNEEIDPLYVDTILDKRPQYREDVIHNRGTFDFNKSGSFMFNIRETKATEYGNWRLKHDDGEDNGLSLQVQGVHFVNNGSFYMWGIPEQTRMPLSHILDLMPNNASFDMAAAAIQDQYLKRIKHIENVMNGDGRLEYTEWATPQGISTIKAPHLNSTLFMYSPNCRLVISAKDGVGMKREKFFSKAVNYAGMAGTIAFIQVFLLVRQMEYTPTPSSPTGV